MNIALLTMEYVIDKSGAGGLANYTHRMAIALKQAGHNPVVVYCPWIQEYPKDAIIEHDGISIYIAKPTSHPLFRLLAPCVPGLKLIDRILCKIGKKKYATSSESINQLLRYLMYSYGARKKISALRNELGLDVCQYTHLFGLGALADKRILTSCRLSSHPDLWAPFGMPTAWAERLMQDIAIRRSKLLFAPSSFVSKYAETIYHRAVPVLPSPYLIRQEKAQLSTLQAEKSYGLYFGTLAEWKGIRHLVGALRIVFSMHHTLNFYFVGRDLGQIEGISPSQYIREELAGYSEQIKLIGCQDQDSLHGLIKGSMFCCFPTLADNFPNVVLDAMDASKCIISTHGRGVDEQIINGESGILVAPESETELADAIVKVINMTDEDRREYGRKARERLECFSPQSCASQLVKTYKQYLPN